MKIYFNNQIAKFLEGPETHLKVSSEGSYHLMSVFQKFCDFEFGCNFETNKHIFFLKIKI